MKSVSFKKENKDWQVPDAFYRISVKALILNSDKQLLVLRDVTANRDEGGVYELPGGGLDWGESEKEALRRELEEELSLMNVEIEERPIASIYGVHPKGYRTLKIYYSVTLNNKPVDNEPESLRHSWVGKNEFLELEMPGDESGIQDFTDLIYS